MAERTEIGKEIEVREAIAARERQTEHGHTAPGRPRDTSAKLSGVSKGEAKARAAKAVGMSRPTYEKAKAVVEAAQAEPGKFADLQEQMDATGKVSPAHAELERRKAEKAHVAESIEQARQPGEVFVDEQKTLDEIVQACRGIRTRTKHFIERYGVTDETQNVLRPVFQELLDLLE